MDYLAVVCEAENHYNKQLKSIDEYARQARDRACHAYQKYKERLVLIRHKYKWATQDAIAVRNHDALWQAKKQFEQDYHRARRYYAVLRGDFKIKS